ncbi:MAG: transglycosylase SLT domain-containing protein, partial [Ruminococcus sp.]|nr:transglycosylase SLT domain-containing protein [Ruminococcus sp.]
MSRYDRRHSRETKGHGALGFLITFVLIAFVIVLVIFFLSSDDAFKGAKKKVYSVFYPQKYEQQVQKYAKEFGVEEPLIYSVIRTESGFRPEVVSSAGAMGL